jgi:hypothetical protein
LNPHWGASATFVDYDRDGCGLLAFLAMAQYRVGQHQGALTTQEQLRQTMQKPEWAMKTEAQRFMHEAEALLR